MTGRIRIGIVGAGRWAAGHHLPALLDDRRVTVTCLADPRPAKRRLAGAAFGIPAAFPSATELYRAGLADAVVIAAPHARHYELVAGALDAGLHVLAEKPLTLDPLEAWRLVARARQRRLHLVVGYPYEFARHTQQARQMVRDIAPIRLLSCLYASPRAHLFRRQASQPPALDRPDVETYCDPAISGGGQGQTEVTHVLACLLHAIRLEVAEVSAWMSCASYPVDVVDGLLLRFRTAAIGTLASIGTVAHDHPAQRELRYYGDNGVVLHDLTSGTVTCQVPGRRDVTFRSRPGEEIYPTRAPARCLVDAIVGAASVPVDPGIAAHAVACLAAAYRSARGGGQPTAVLGPDGSAAGVDDLEHLGQPARSETRGFGVPPRRLPLPDGIGVL